MFSLLSPELYNNVIKIGVVTLFIFNIMYNIYISQCQVFTDFTEKNFIVLN